MKFALFFIILIINNIMMINQGYAVGSEDLYIATVEIPYRSMTLEQKDEIIKQEFSKVIKRIVGRKFDFDLQDPEKYVNKIEYQIDNNVPNNYDLIDNNLAINSDLSQKTLLKKEKLILKIYFDQVLIDRLLSDNGASFLKQQDRPKTFIWLKKNNLSKLDLVQKLLQEIIYVGSERGLSIVCPGVNLDFKEHLDNIDLNQASSVNVSEQQLLEKVKLLAIKHQAQEIIVADSKEYDNKLDLSCFSIIDDWQFNIQLTEQENDYKSISNNFIDQLLDKFLRSNLSNSNSDENKETILINIVNIINLEDYVKIEKYLQNLSVINDLKAIKFQTGEVEFEAKINCGSTQAIKNIINGNNLLKENNKYKVSTSQNENNKLFYEFNFS